MPPAPPCPPPTPTRPLRPTLPLMALLAVAALVSRTLPATATPGPTLAKESRESREFRESRESRESGGSREPREVGEPILDVNLSALIDGLQSKYSRMQGLAADFTQLYAGPDGRTARESGRLKLKRPGKARWEYTEPERKLFVSDGRNIFFYVEGERQASQTSVKASADPQIPFLFLLGRGNLRRDFSRIELISSERPAAPGNIVLRLVPKRAPEEFRQLLVEVSPSTLAVHRMVIFERNGARMDFLLTNLRENFIAPESDFHFTPPPGVTLRKQ